MKKFGIGLLITIGVLGLLLLVARVTGILLFYSVPAFTNEPTLKNGSLIFVSGINNTEANKFIVFKSPYHDSVFASYQSDYPSGSKYIYRLCGMPDDIVEMKNGVLFVNNRNFDEHLDLKKQYKISKEDFALIDKDDYQEEDSYQFIQPSDSVIVTFSKSLYNKYAAKIKLTQYFINDITLAGDCFKWYKDTFQWTPDNFGPLKVPLNCYFVLGDNRHNAMDSRYTGFVEKENITGIVINK